MKSTSPGSAPRSSSPNMGIWYPEFFAAESFSQALRVLMRVGQRPPSSGQIGKPWSPKELAEGLGVNERMVRYYMNDTSIPQALENLEREFFGMNQAEFYEIRLHLRKLKEERGEQKEAFDRYADRSTVELVWRYVLEKTGPLPEAPERIEATNINDLKWLVARLFQSKTPSQLHEIVVEARASAFDQKYGQASEERDERSLVGMDAWAAEFTNILNNLGVTQDSKLLVVGTGCGFEGKGIYDKFTKFVGVDLSARSVERCRAAFPGAQLLVGEAEDLPDVTAGSDVYVSLKTFQSSFFDIQEAITSCHSALNPGGKAIISVPRGYFGRGGSSLEGLARTDYNLKSAGEKGTYRAVDRSYPIELVKVIADKLHQRRFEDVRIHTGMVEHYVIAQRR